MNATIKYKTIDVYDTQYFIIIGSTFYEAIKDGGLKKEFAKKNNLYTKEVKSFCDNISGMSSFFHAKGNNCIILNGKKSNADLIAHESFHLASNILNEVGIKLNKATEEAYAYLIGHIVSVVTKEVELWRRSKLRR